MVLLLSSDSETFQRGKSHLMARLQHFCLVESLYFFIFFQSIHSLVLQSLSVMRANEWYMQKAYMDGINLLFSAVLLDMFFMLRIPT